MTRLLHAHFDNCNTNPFTMKHACSKLNTACTVHLKTLTDTKLKVQMKKIFIIRHCRLCDWSNIIWSNDSLQRWLDLFVCTEAQDALWCWRL